MVDWNYAMCGHGGDLAGYHEIGYLAVKRGGRRVVALATLIPVSCVGFESLHPLTNFAYTHTLGASRATKHAAIGLGWLRRRRDHNCSSQAPDQVWAEPPSVREVGSRVGTAPWLSRQGRNIDVRGTDHLRHSRPAEDQLVVISFRI